VTLATVCVVFGPFLGAFATGGGAEADPVTVTVAEAVAVTVSPAGPTPEALTVFVRAPDTLAEQV
jgi:hypothetical protein